MTNPPKPSPTRIAALHLAGSEEAAFAAIRNYLEFLLDTQRKVVLEHRKLISAVGESSGENPWFRFRIFSEVADDVLAALEGQINLLEKVVAAGRPGSRTAAARVKTAGEVRFIKDKSGDASQWAWSDAGPQERKITPDFAFNPRNTKALATVLRSANAAMGHAMSAYTVFAKLKSSHISPDGSLGGKGYIQKIAEMRRAFMNVIEALSALSDTLDDEIRAPHWAAVSRQGDPEEREEVESIVEDALKIKKDPEEWAEEQMEEFSEENQGKTAARAVKLAARPPVRVWSPEQVDEMLPDVEHSSRTWGVESNLRPSAPPVELAEDIIWQLGYEEGASGRAAPAAVASLLGWAAARGHTPVIRAAYENGKRDGVGAGAP